MLAIFVFLTDYLIHLPLRRDRSLRNAFLSGFCRNSRFASGFAIRNSRFFLVFLSNNQFSISFDLNGL